MKHAVIDPHGHPIRFVNSIHVKKCVHLCVFVLMCVHDHECVVWRGCN